MNTVNNQKKLSEELESKLIEDIKNGMSHRKIAAKYRVSKTLVTQKYARQLKIENEKIIEKEVAEEELKNNLSTFSKIFEKMDEELSSNRDTDDLIEMLKVESKRKIDSENAKKNFNVSIKEEGPIGISFFGDPHIDNEGCDWNELYKDIQIVKHTKGMYAGNIGDQTDNWVGRLSKFFQNQKLSRSEALKLVEWMFKEIPWLFIVMGNHDHWNADTGNVLDYIYRLSQVPGYKIEHDARINLHFPNKNIATIRARHNFAGKSTMNPVHGMVKETQLNMKDDILVCGDWHHSGYQPIWYNEGGKGFNVGGPILCHAIRVGTYKVVDTYALECGFKEENWAPNIVAIIDPYTDSPKDKVKIEFSTEAGADRLNWMRDRFFKKNKKTYDLKRGTEA